MRAKIQIRELENQIPGPVVGGGPKPQKGAPAWCILYFFLKNPMKLKKLIWSVGGDTHWERPLRSATAFISPSCCYGNKVNGFGILFLGPIDTISCLLFTFMVKKVFIIYSQKVQNKAMFKYRNQHPCAPTVEVITCCLFASQNHFAQRGKLFSFSCPPNACTHIMFEMYKK